MENRSVVSVVELAPLLSSWRRPGAGYAALAGALRSLVLDGRLPLRARLPSERTLAESLGVSRTMTTAAYDMLRGEGFLESRRGSGSRIALPTGGAIDRELDPPGLDDEGGIDMTIASLPAPGQMMDAVARATRELAAHLGGHGYDPRGLPSLRRAVANGFTARGVPTDQEQIVVTAGAQHALALLVQVLVEPDDPVLVEEPSYPNAFVTFRRAGVRIVPAPMRQDGWNLQGLSALFRREEPRLAFMVCDFQNPTGHLMGDDQRAELVAEASRAGSQVVVDETFASLDLEPWRPSPMPVAAHDPEGRVVTIGSMSKAYWGGLRVGWIRCTPPLARRLAQARAGIDLATAVLEQLIAVHLLEAGEQILAERRGSLAQRRDALVAALRRDLPAWRFVVPRGGLCLWVELERPEARSLEVAAGAEGVRIIPGPTFSVDGTLDRRIRLPFTQRPDVLEDAVERLATAAWRLGAREDRAGMIA